MATISLTFTDSINGIITKSVKLSEEDMIRIFKALKALYFTSADDQGVSLSDITPEQVVELYTLNVTRNIIHAVNNHEIDSKLLEFRNNFKDVEII